MGRPLGEGRAVSATLERVARLMAARLALVVALLGAVVALSWAGRDLSDRAWNGISATLALAFLATVLCGAAFRRVRHVGRFGALQIATDVVLVTSLVHFSGGSESVFSSLYVLVVVYGALLFDRKGAYGAAALAMAGFGLALVLQRTGWLGAAASDVRPPVRMLIGLWSVHGGALVLVALLASMLSRELHRAGAALDQSRSDLRHLQSLHARTVESLLSGLLTTDREGRITSFNPEAERITARPAAEALGAHIDQVLPGARELVMEPLGARESSRTRARMPYRNQRAELLHLGLSGSILREADGSATGHVVIFQDVTQVVAMEKELRRSERLAAAGQLSADLAHEIRNPLAAISGSVQMLRAGLGEGAADAEGRRLLEIVLRETDRLNQLISDFLYYARPAAPKPVAVPVAETIEEVLRMFETTRPANVEVATDVPPELAVRADAAHVRQLLWNLVLNAAQAMPEGGTLTLRARAVAGRGAQEPGSEGRNGASEGRGSVEIAVVDTGVGIPSEVMDRIFDPFFTTKREGTGLGLATVHRIVEGNGGTLRVESAVGSGTAFQIRLPRAEGGA